MTPKEDKADAVSPDVGSVAAAPRRGVRGWLLANRRLILALDVIFAYVVLMLYLMSLFDVGRRSDISRSFLLVFAACVLIFAFLLALPRLGNRPAGPGPAESRQPPQKMNHSRFVFAAILCASIVIVVAFWILHRHFAGT